MNNPQYKYVLTIAYDGTHYGGWQVQNNAPSIQAAIQLVLQTILQRPIKISGSGRTDAGVHALGQVAHFTLETAVRDGKAIRDFESESVSLEGEHPQKPKDPSNETDSGSKGCINLQSPTAVSRVTGQEPIDLDKTFASVNRLLPPDIRILSLKEAPADFHARYSATSKIYHYHLHLDAVADPFKRLYAYQPHHKVDLELLKKCAAYFVGTHDFTSFSHHSKQGAAAHDAVRTLYRLEIKEEPGGIRLEFEGDGFLYKMVRNIVGTLLDVCAGKIKEDDIEKIRAAKDRKLAGRTAPPEGLFLVKVNYTENHSNIGF